jgi:DNA polymerase
MHEPLPHRGPAANAVVAAQHVLHRDDETRSCVSLKKLGAHKYAADPNTQFLCRAFAVDDGPVQLWTRGDPIPAEFSEAARNPNWSVAAHGDHFESANERHILGPQFNWPLVPPERHICTQAMCLAVGLPAKLSAAADALGSNS